MIVSVPALDETAPDAPLAQADESGGERPEEKGHLDESAVTRRNPGRFSSVRTAFQASDRQVLREASADVNESAQLEEKGPSVRRCRRRQQSVLSTCALADVSLPGMSA